MAKMTRDEMIEKLDSLYEAMHIRYSGKTYQVTGIVRVSATGKHRTDVLLLEVGKPATEQKFIRFGPRKGEAYTASNVEYYSWYAERQYMDWEIVAA